MLDMPFENFIFRLLIAIILSIPFLILFFIPTPTREYEVCRSGYVFNRDIRGNEVQVFSETGPIKCNEL